MRKLIITLTKTMVHQEDKDSKARVMCTATGTHHFAEHMRANMHEPGIIISVQDQATHPYPGCPACGHPINSHINHEGRDNQLAHVYVGACKEDGCHCRYWIEKVKEVILP